MNSDFPHHGRARVRTSSFHALATLLACSFGAAIYQGCSSAESDPVSDAGTSPDVAVSPDSGTDATSNDVTVTEAAADVTQDVVKESSASADASDAAADGPVDTGTDAAASCPPDDAGAVLPNDLRCTGLYEDFATRTIKAGVTAYTPGYQAWSDGALKSRFILLPAGEKIDNSDFDEWTFPAGTKIWKEFRLGTQRIETRFMLKAGAGAGNWLATTYRWSADELTATRLDDGELNVNGVGYEIPSSAQCTFCHAGRKDWVLGFDAIGLGTAAAQGITLANLVNDGRLTVSMPQTLEIPNDSTGLARAPFGWLHANCGTACHNKNFAALASSTGLFLRMSATHLIAEAGTVNLRDLDPYVRSVNVTPVNPNFSSKGYKRIFPGDPSMSLIPLFDGTRNSDAGIPQMPPIISHVAPTADVAALSAWITAMPTDGGL